MSRVFYKKDNRSLSSARVLASYAVAVSLYGKLWTTPLLVLVPRKVTAATILKNVHGWQNQRFWALAVFLYRLAYQLFAAAYSVSIIRPWPSLSIVPSSSPNDNHNYNLYQLSPSGVFRGDPPLNAQGMSGFVKGRRSPVSSLRLLFGTANEAGRTIIFPSPDFGGHSPVPSLRQF